MSELENEDIIKMSEVFLSALEHSKAQCPSCGSDLVLTPKLPEKQTMRMRIQYEYPHLRVRTVYGVMQEIDKMFQALGKEFGMKTHVFLGDIEQKPGEIEIGFQITASVLGAGK